MKVGINGASRDITDLKAGISGAVHSVGEVWIGVNGAVKQVWPNIEFFYEEKTFTTSTLYESTISFEIPFNPGYLIGICSTPLGRGESGNCVRCFSYSTSENSFWGTGDNGNYVDLSSDVSSVKYSNGTFSFNYKYDVYGANTFTYRVLAVKAINENSYLGEETIDSSKKWGYKFYTGFEPDYFLAYAKQNSNLFNTNATINAITKLKTIGEYIYYLLKVNKLTFNTKEIGSEFTYSSGSLTLDSVSGLTFEENAIWTWLAVKEK